MGAEHRMFPSVKESISMNQGKISFRGNSPLWTLPIKVELWSFHVKAMRMTFSQSMSTSIRSAPMLKYRYGCNLCLFIRFVYNFPIFVVGKWCRTSRWRHIGEVCGRFQFFYGEVRNPLNVLLLKSVEVAKCSWFCQLPLPPVVSVNTNKLMNSLTVNWRRGVRNEKDFRLPSVVNI
jgi:hypothetical protein